jgi:hypothetical protein
LWLRENRSKLRRELEIITEVNDYGGYVTMQRGVEPERAVPGARVEGGYDQDPCNEGSGV